MKLIIGLGNAGDRYTQTRHNIGFMVVDAIAKNYNAGFSVKPNLHGILAEVAMAADKLLLLKPTTMMNDSGAAAAAVMAYYKIAVSDVVVIYDDVDVPFGTVRYRTSDTASQHLGIQSILRVVGADPIHQVRIGVGDNRAVGLPSEVYVLQPFTQEEAASLQTWLPMLAQAVVEQVSHFADRTDQLS